jgi:methyltransferase
MSALLAHLDGLSVAVLAALTLQRLAELVHSHRNETWLRANGAVEFGAAHYPAMVAIHAAWLLALWVFASAIRPGLAWLAVFAVLQALRVWVLSTLGRRWTTRIMVLPQAPLVARGPYRWLSHPNYAVVTAEIFVLPMAYGLVWAAVLFTALNAAILWVRIGTENTALRGAGAT